MTEEIEIKASADTKERPIIAARERGPGPGRYGLPPCCGYQQHDFTKYRGAAYSFGKRLELSMFSKDGSPGPVHKFDAALSRFGKDGAPSYSMLGRQKPLNTFKTPSPGKYYPEKAHPQGERHAPVYSMGSRTRYCKRDSTPSSNSYFLPPLIGSKVPNKLASASYSMAGRPVIGSFSEDLCKTPGPGRYNSTSPNVRNQKQPIYTMLGRTYMPGDATVKPGPGAYSPENVTVTKRQTPRFSMGIRHSEFVTPLIMEVK